jgi:hypothetical protein
MENTTFSMAEYEHELDKIVAPTFPESHEVHTRIQTYEASLDKQQREFANELANRLVESKGVARSTATEAAIEQARKKL